MMNMRSKPKESKKKARVPVEFELSPEMDAALESYATAKGLTVEDAAGELVRAGLAAFQKLPPDKARAEVERLKASKREGGAK